VTRSPAETDLRAAIRDGYGFDFLRLEFESDDVDAAAWAWRASTTKSLPAQKIRNILDNAIVRVLAFVVFHRRRSSAGFSTQHTAHSTQHRRVHDMKIVHRPSPVGRGS
jgi:hypothetical protein